MNRLQTLHETLIPVLVAMSGAKSYLEFGTYQNDTISKVVCNKRYGVDLAPVPLDGAQMFAMPTSEFIQWHAHQHAPFDFVFIDADHSADAVRADLFGIINFVSPEGIICLHDTNPETKADATPGLCGDTWKFAQFLNNDSYEAVTLPYHPGLTIIRNRVSWGPR